MNSSRQTCSMSAEPNKALRQTSLPYHRYLENTTRAAALVGTRHTYRQIWGVSVSVATQQIKRSCSSFGGFTTGAKGVEAATEGEAAALAYPWVAAAAATADAIMARISRTPVPMVSPVLLLQAVHPLLPCPLWVRYFLRAFLLWIWSPSPRVLVRLFWRSSIFFRAPPQSRVFCSGWTRGPACS